MDNQGTSQAVSNLAVDVTVPPVCPDLLFNLRLILGLILSESRQVAFLGPWSSLPERGGKRVKGETNSKVICKNGAWGDGTLCGHGRPIHLILANLIEAVEMNTGCLVAEVVRYLHNKAVSLAHIDRWRWPLVIHSNHGTSKPVRGDPFPSEAPLQ